MNNNAETTAAQPNPTQQQLLLGLAVAALRYGLEHGTVMPLNTADYEADLRAPLATFVTLKKQGQLRGCIGTLAAQRPLVEDVVYNTWQAAAHDPRFEPLRADELPDLHVSISILSPPQALTVTSEQELYEQLRPGEDGLIIEDGYNRATFLPSVWQQLPDPIDFVTHLKLKAGLSADHWSTTMRLQRYTSFEFGSAVSALA
jgi:AmmeMemoRadiSam system protein A